MAEPDDLASRIDTIERGYEYLLAYAAQGRQDDAGSEARVTLTNMHVALTGFEAALLKALETLPEAVTPDVAAFLDAIIEDADKARGAFALVLSRPRISSMLVDNLNASIHLRALLTDLFLVEQARK